MAILDVLDPSFDTILLVLVFIIPRNVVAIAMLYALYYFCRFNAGPGTKRLDMTGGKGQQHSGVQLGMSSANSSPHRRRLASLIAFL